MTSFRQIEANRRNSAKSTGPQTEEGKQRSRCNAIRHGLTAETVIGALEDAEDYRAFEAAITADYDAQSAVERELVLRLASLLCGFAARPRSKQVCSKFRLVSWSDCDKSGRLLARHRVPNGAEKHVVVNDRRPRTAATDEVI
jgi:hypothetical protein